MEFNFKEDMLTNGWTTDAEVIRILLVQSYAFGQGELTTPKDVENMIQKQIFNLTFDLLYINLGHMVDIYCM